MSHENVELVRSAYDAFNQGDWDGALAVVHADVEWRLHGDLGIDSTEPVRGREPLRAFWANFFEVWENPHMEPLDVAEPHPGTVLATVRFTAQGQGSSVPIELTYFWVHVVSGGEVASVDVYVDRSEALAAVGLED